MTLTNLSKFPAPYYGLAQHNAVNRGIIQEAAECLQHPATSTVNLISAGCGNVIIPRLTTPASMSNGGFAMDTPQTDRDIVQRFWAKVQKSSDCWIWTASKRNKGYGAFAYTWKGQMIHDRAHRFSYRLHLGDIPDGLFVLHRCDTPACVNPAHLFLGTNYDNVRDMHAKGRKVVGGTHCGDNGKWKRGEIHHAAKMTAESVRELRSLHEQGWSFSRLGVRYGINQSAVYKIVHRLRWKHVD